MQQDISLAIFRINLISATIQGQETLNKTDSITS